MNIRELQLQYANGQISYDEYATRVEEIRNQENESKSSNNVYYYLFGIGILSYFLLRKK